MKNKHGIFFGFAVFLITAMFIMSACGGSTAPTSNFEFEIIDNGIKITGYNGAGGKLIIPGKINGTQVVVIGEQAFQKKKLTSVTIPQGVTVIEENAFYDNVELTSVIIPESVLYIGTFAFAGTKLSSVTITEECRLADGAFFGPDPKIIRKYRKGD